MICIAGKNNIAVWALRYLIWSNVARQDILVLPNASDSGIDTWQPSLIQCAKTLGVRLVHIHELYELENLLFISLEYDRLIRTECFQSTRLFNIHFSNLPKYRGAYTSVMPILHGESHSGVTLHKIDNGTDTGEIIDRIVFPIGINDTARDLYMKYNTHAFALFRRHIDSLRNDSYTSMIQESVGASYFSRTEIDFSNIAINLKKTSFEIHNQLRAFIFKEYQLPKLLGICIEQSILTSEFIGRNVLIDDGDCFVLSGIDGWKIVARKYRT